jgi:hypothetical protein
MSQVSGAVLSMMSASSTHSTMTRRRALGLGLMIACGCCCRLDPAWAAYNFDTMAFESSSGDRDLDRALAISLSELSDMFGVLPGFAFFDDGDTLRGNAFAGPSKRLGRADGSVAFGKKLLHILLQEEHGEAAVIGVCAHEFGHIAQWKHKVRDTLISNGKVKRLELHADYCAGYFAGRRKLEKRDFPAAVIAQAQYAEGDYAMASVDSHGTPEERGQAVVEGFEAAYRHSKTFDRAFNDGIKLVSRYPV